MKKRDSRQKKRALNHARAERGEMENSWERIAPNKRVFWRKQQDRRTSLWEGAQGQGERGRGFSRGGGEGKKEGTLGATRVKKGKSRHALGQSARKCGGAAKRTERVAQTKDPINPPSSPSLFVSRPSLSWLSTAQAPPGPEWRHPSCTPFPLCGWGGCTGEGARRRGPAGQGGGGRRAG